MIARRGIAIGLWLAAVAVAALLAARARYVADLSGFLPASPDDAQQLLVEQLGSGPASRLLLLAIEGSDEATRLRLSRELAAGLAKDEHFSEISNGERLEEDGAFLLRHRYLLSDAVDQHRFTAEGLREAIGATLDELSSTAGLLLADLLPRDPTGELAHLGEQLVPAEGGPSSIEGRWSSRDGGRMLLVARTRSTGADTDGQEAALEALKSRFAGLSPGEARLLVSGPAVFAVEARRSIVGEAMRLSLLGSALTLGLLLYVYRSPRVLALGMVPVATGALMGVAAVATGFGLVHGLTLGFGITLIGEAVDYAIYLFVQLGRGDRDTDRLRWLREFWPTIRLGMLTSICGFLVLLPSGFPGLAQLGLYSVTGLVAAALVTRGVLPWLLPRGFHVRDVSALGNAVRKAAMRAHASRALRALPLLAAACACGVLWLHRGSLWQQELASLSPVPAEAQSLDARLRAELGAPDVRDLVVVSGTDREQVLRRAEALEPVLQGLVDGGVLGGYENPARLLPSEATQSARRAALPTPEVLRSRLAVALQGLPLRPARLEPFVEDVAAAREAPLLTAGDFAGTSLAAALDSLLIESSRGWRAMLPLRAPTEGAVPDIAAIRRAVAAAGVEGVRVLDLKDESDALYRGYLNETVRLALLGLAAVVLLLAIARRSLPRTLRLVVPLLLAVLCTTAVLALAGRQLSLLHVVGLLLTVAIGSNYALFFDGAGARAGALDSPQTYASVLLASATSVLGFGVLASSHVPVLRDLGETVAVGGVLALLFSALLTAPPPPRTAGG